MVKRDYWFNLRAYGICINARGELLLSTEVHQGQVLTKFPGGGLEFGEGLIDCLMREWKEETGLVVEVLGHYYTTDFFQPSAFQPKEQVISVYYRVSCPEPAPLPTEKFNIQRFSWVALASLTEEQLTLPIDKVVARMLIQDAPKLLYLRQTN